MTTSVMRAVRSDGACGWSFGYDRAAVDRLIDSGDLDVAYRLAAAAAGNADGLDIVRYVIQAVGCSSVWICGGAPDWVEVSADFTCDGEGFMVNDNHLTLSVYLHTGVVVADAGIGRLTDLPHVGFVTVHDVLAGVVTLLNDCAERAVRALLPLPAPLALQVIPVADLRTAVTEDVSVNAAESEGVAAASDEAIAQALVECWAVVEDRFFTLREELIAAALRRLLVGPQPAGASPVDAESAFSHNIAVGVYGDSLAVSWPGGRTTVIEAHHAETGDLYEGLCDALDAIEGLAECQFHSGDQRDALACVCAGPTAAAGE